MKKELSNKQKANIFRKAIPTKMINEHRNKEISDPSDPDQTYSYLDKIGVDRIVGLLAGGLEIEYVATKLKVFVSYLKLWLSNPARVNIYNAGMNFDLKREADKAVRKGIKNTDKDKETVGMINSNTKAAQIAYNNSKESVNNKIDVGEISLTMISQVVTPAEAFVVSKEQAKAIEVDQKE